MKKMLLTCSDVYIAGQAFQNLLLEVDVLDNEWHAHDSADLALKYN